MMKRGGKMNQLDIRKRLILLNHLRGLGWKTIYEILKTDPTLNILFENRIPNVELPFPLKKFFQIQSQLKMIHLEQLLQQYQQNKISILTILDSEYPNHLKHIYRPPWVLYYQGNVNLLKEERILAIVGTRTPTPYGIQVAKDLIPNLVNEKFVIVSGLALGIDSYAHLNTIQSGGKTIAILGSGLLQVYPKQNRQLAGIIGSSHLLLSEYPPFQKAEKHFFPERNRIISGISKGTLVIEAKERSGSLITAQMALDAGREVFAVPGPIMSEMSKGTNRLIQDGAKLVTNFHDILTEF